ncbi:MAG TPA: hypothetical protein VGS22_23080 [Thermoanaerobaculia bacterium]|jgi:hypothetical protein|nr:hypothetical protein [Thermoanaerobaculia bacterium]
MPDKSFYLGKWRITSSSTKAFKPETTLTIEEITAGAAECRVHWIDVEDLEHNLRKVMYDGGTQKMVGNPAQHESSDSAWSIAISQDGTGKHLHGLVISPDLAVEGDDHAESNLAGVWGAEAQTP